ncbi:MAG: recombinase family protein [Pseudonocardiaceae bacterium]
MRETGATVAYCRVSSHDQKADLERQAGRVLTMCSGRGIRIDRTVTEIESGLNGRRTKLRRLLADPEVSTIVVEHRDRLARFGVEYLVVRARGARPDRGRARYHPRRVGRVHRQHPRRRVRLTHFASTPR